VPKDDDHVEGLPDPFIEQAENHVPSGRLGLDDGYDSDDSNESAVQNSSMMKAHRIKLDPRT